MTISVPVDFDDAALTAEMTEDLAAVEVALRDTSFGGNEMFAEVSRHMMTAGGKRFRALLVLLAYALGAAAGGGNGNMSTLFVERLTDVSLGAILALIGTAVAFPHRVDGDADGDDKGPPR